MQGLGALTASSDCSMKPTHALRVESIMDTTDEIAWMVMSPLVVANVLN